MVLWLLCMIFEAVGGVWQYCKNFPCSMMELWRCQLLLTIRHMTRMHSPLYVESIMKGQPTKSGCPTNWEFSFGLRYYSSAISFFRANLSDGIQSLVLYSIECADTSFRDLESFLLVERFIASEIFRGKKCWEMWVPNHVFLVALQRLMGMIGGKSMVFWRKKKRPKNWKPNIEADMEGKNLIYNLTVYMSVVGNF